MVDTHACTFWRKNVWYIKQLLDEVFVICRIIKVEVSVTSEAEGVGDNT
jgi:hypothetical protein